MDVLRTVSIWSVMIGHVAYWFHPGADGVFYTWVRPLLLGVEPFFVLGGFLAALTFHHMYQKGHGSYRLQDVRSYWYRRWMRTLPNYFLFLAIYTVAFTVVRPEFGFDWRYLVFSQNLFWLAPRFFSISWSLSTQEWFYLLFPLVFYFLFKARIRKPIIWASLFFIGISLVFRLWFARDPGYEDLEGFIRRVAVLRLDSVVVGVLTGWLYFSRYQERRYTVPAFVIGFVGIVVLAFLRPVDSFNSLGWVQQSFYPVFSLMLGLTMPIIYEMKDTAWPRVNRIFEKTSKWSYSIYLCHVFFLDGIHLVAQKMGWLENMPVMIGLATTWVALVYVTSGLLYRKYEVPLMLRLKPQHRGSAASASQPQNSPP